MKNIIAALILITLSACGSHQPVDLSEKNNNKSIQTVQIEKAALSSVIKLPGQLKPFQEVDIYPKVNGFVKDMHVDRGSVVHTGEILMALEAPEINEQYQAALDKLLQARESLNASRDRYSRLNEAAKTPGAVAELDLVNARSKYQADSAFEQSEKADVNAVQALKDYLIVRAPFDGVITERNVHPGTLIGPDFKQQGKPLLNLQDNRKLRLEVFVPEEYAAMVDMNDKQIVFTTDALPGQTFNAAISRSSNSLNNDYRSEAIEADVMNKDNTFKPGMYIEASLKVTSQVSSYLVPSFSIVTSSENKYVIAVQDGKAKYIPVKEGVSNSGKTEVYGNFTGNEMIIKNASSEIKEGAPVN